MNSIIWTESESRGNAAARAELDDGINLLISQYGQDTGCAGQWYWQVHCGTLSCSGILPTRDMAMAQAERIARTGIDGLRQHEAERILAEIDDLASKLHKISPAAATDLIGWQAGYDAGLRAAEARVLAAIRQDTH